MSKDSSNTDTDAEHGETAGIPWKPWLGVLFIILVYYAAQIAAGVLLSIYPGLRHWSQSQTFDWLDNSVGAQFLFILLAEALSIGAVYLFLKGYRRGFGAIGLKKPRWSDVGRGLMAVPVYFLLYVVVVGLVSHFVPGLNVDQRQEIGFDNVHGGLALVLSGIGLYGLVSFSVVGRTREIGVRMALGAQTADVLRLVVRQGMSPVVIGLIIGLAAALGLGRLLTTQLYGVSANNPLYLAGTAALLAVVGFCACLIPARRATLVNPIEALRNE